MAVESRRGRSRYGHAKSESLVATARLHAFLRRLVDSRTELAIPFASAVLILVLADPVMMTALSRLAPALHEQAFSVSASTRRWIVGAPPALAYLAFVGHRLWRATRDR